MRLTTRPIPRLMLLPLLLTVSSCGSTVSTLPTFPNVTDLHCPDEPTPTAEILTSAKVSEDYAASVRAMGAECRATVHRICNWAKALGDTVTCD